MPIHNSEIAKIFNNYADLLEIEGENPFRIRAYRNAARVIGGTSQSLDSMLKEGKNFTQLPGIGRDLSEKIITIINTGKLPQLEEIEERLPEILCEFMKIPGLGPKRIKILFDTFNIRSVKELSEVIRGGKINQLKGFGQKIVKLIQDGLQLLGKINVRVKLCDAEEYAKNLIEYLKKAKGILRVEIAGSYRRCAETVGDIDILVIAKNPSAITSRFIKYEAVIEIISHGPTRSAVKLRSGLHVDLRVVAKECYGAALYYFTGSKAHNIAVRKIAKQKHLKINEYGVFKNNKRIAGQKEEDIFKCVGLTYIEPELREDRGEIEAAKKRTLPSLISLQDIRGDLHSHTKKTDGLNSLEEMVTAAEALGYSYIAITEHSKHVGVARGLDERALIKYLKTIDRLNKVVRKITVLKSIEVDILENGELDLSDNVLKELDLTVCAIHYKFSLSKKKQTERILRAMDNRYFNILAHPTGRLINKREPYAINIEQILQGAKSRGCVLELNAQPERLDLNDLICKMAKEIGLKMVISTDAHSIANLSYMQYGINQARRGWLEPKDIINTRELMDLKKLLAR